jgi:hypothetical protein
MASEPDLAEGLEPPQPADYNDTTVRQPRATPARYRGLRRPTGSIPQVPATFARRVSPFLTQIRR